MSRGSFDSLARGDNRVRRAIAALSRPVSEQVALATDPIVKQQITGAQWIIRAWSFPDFAIAAVSLRSFWTGLPPGSIIHDVMILSEGMFLQGGAIASLTANVHITANAVAVLGGPYTLSGLLGGPPLTTQLYTVLTSKGAIDFSNSLVLDVELVATGDNLDKLIGGSLVAGVLVSRPLSVLAAMRAGNSGAAAGAEQVSTDFIG